MQPSSLEIAEMQPILCKGNKNQLLKDKFKYRKTARRTLQLFYKAIDLKPLLSFY